MADHRVSRREFVRTGAAAAAAVAAGLTPTYTVGAGNPNKDDTSGILNYNSDMEYRRCGRTNLMISAVCLGGHWKRVNTVVPDLFKGRGWLSADTDNADFEENRTEVVSRCMDRGINYIDACTGPEVIMYAKALKGRRDKMYLGYSWHNRESRFADWQNSADKMKEGFAQGIKEAGAEYADLWRITMHEQTSKRNTQKHIEVAMEALAWAKKEGLARFTGISSHDRAWIRDAIATYPQLEVICTPYTAKTKVVTDEHGLWAAMKEHDVGWFGIKPFASNSLFKGDSSPGNPHEEEDDRLARLAIRYILCNRAITAPIPGLITPRQVDNVALAVMERRELDMAEKAELERAMDRVWANLPYHYRWLKDWEYI
ncbi:MAG: aldo/keto reductase [Planctomycetota bacterium]|jgi:aryl-alcohol dehydrogenase-like predicted oxidoreductase